MKQDADQPGRGRKAALEDLLAGVPCEKVVILCIGNVMRGDDGFGPAVYERLQGRLACSVVNGDVTPENDLPRIASLSPSVVVFVDAVRSGARPGALSVFEPDNLALRGFDTHTGSMTAVAAYLGQACGAKSVVLAAEPRSTELGEGLSQPVSNAVEEVVALLVRLLGTSG